MSSPDDELKASFPPILREIFPKFNDEELAEANGRLAEFFCSVYVRYQDEIERAIADSGLDN